MTCVVDFKSVPYTYLCHAASRYTWIDHCLGSPHDDTVIRCDVMEHNDDNVSDHLPLCLYTRVSWDPGAPASALAPTDCRFPARWDDPQKVRTYHRALQDELSRMNVLKDVDCADRIQDLVDDRLDLINRAIHEATEEAGCIPRCRYPPKPYWTPELSILRDRKRFWWRLWVCNNRPRSGPVYETYKYLKKQFRKISRQTFNQCRSRTLDKLNGLFSQRKMTAFWNQLKQHRRDPV